MGHIWNCLQHNLCGVKKKSVLGPVWLAESWVIPTHRFESESKNTFLRLWQCLLCAGSVMLSLFLLTDSHCVCKLCSFWWSNLAKHREGSCLGLWREDGPENQSSFFFSASWAQSECWSFRPSAHPGWPEGKGKGRGKQQKEGSRVELKVKRVPKSCKWRRWFNTQSDSWQLSWGLNSLDGCTVLACSADTTLCGSFPTPSAVLSLSLFVSVSSLPICMWFRHRLRGEAGPLGERNRGREGERERGREAVNTSFFLQDSARAGIRGSGGSGRRKLWKSEARGCSRS